MGEILLKEKEIVIPGEELARGLDYLPGNGTYRSNDTIRACRLGVLTIDGRAIKIIPLTGNYNPKRDDVIIGKVIDVSLNGWRIETNSAYSGLLSVKDAVSEYVDRGADLTQYFVIGDYVVARIINVTSQKLIDLGLKGPGLRKLSGGRIINVNTNKVPRIIGKQGSMVSLIKDATGCRIIVGQNGIVWIQGDPKQELIAIRAIHIIEEESHLSGLTDRINAFLKDSGADPSASAAINADAPSDDISQQSEQSHESSGYDRRPQGHSYNRGPRRHSNGG